MSTTAPGLPAAQTRAAPTAVPDAVAPPPHHPRFPLLDGMRAIAVLCVVIVHAALMGGAFGPSLAGRLVAHLNIGVTIFFLISGFLLYRPMVAHRGGGASAPRARDYAKRRLLRIYPAYWAVLTFLVICPGLIGVVGGNWLPMYALGHTLPIYSGRRCSELVFSCGLAQTWSLVVEATFYVVLPVYAVALGRITEHLSLRAWLAVELGVLAILSALSVGLQFGVLYPAPAWASGSVAAYCFWFALGMGMAVCSVALRAGLPVPRPLNALGAHPELLWGLALAAYVALSVWLPPDPFLFARSQQLVTHVGFGLIAAAMLAPAVFATGSGGLPRRLLARSAVAWLGLVSYGIFLWHYVIALELGSPGAGGSFVVVLGGTIAISVPVAAASYYLIERPLLRLKYRPFSTARTRSRSQTA